MLRDQEGQPDVELDHGEETRRTHEGRGAEGEETTV